MGKWKYLTLGHPEIAKEDFTTGISEILNVYPSLTLKGLSNNNHAQTEPLHRISSPWHNKLLS